MRSYYGLTRRGHLLLEEGRRRIYHPPRHERWDGAWFLISYSIPENRRQLRDRLRLKLLWLGCGPVTNGLWLSPHDVRSEVREIAHSLRLLRHLEVFRAEHLGFSDTERLVRQCWDLETLDRRYGSFIARWRPQLERCRQGRLPRGRAIRPPLSGLSPEDCFVRRFELTHQYRAFPLEDPYLPARLLPRDWKGDEAAKLFEQYHAALADPADGFLRQVCDAGDDARDGPTALAAGGRA
jgi:phenylacetic acid degradation operon negative regulatory protein